MLSRTWLTLSTEVKSNFSFTPNTFLILSPAALPAGLLLSILLNTLVKPLEIFFCNLLSTSPFHSLLTQLTASSTEPILASSFAEVSANFDISVVKLLTAVARAATDLESNCSSTGFLLIASIVSLKFLSPSLTPVKALLVASLSSFVLDIHEIKAPPAATIKPINCNQGAKALTAAPMAAAVPAIADLARTKLRLNNPTPAVVVVKVFPVLLPASSNKSIVVVILVPAVLKLLIAEESAAPNPCVAPIWAD